MESVRGEKRDKVWQRCTTFLLMMLLHENRAEFLTCNMLRAICKHFDYELCGLSYISNYACCPPLCASPHKRHVALIEKKLIKPNWYWIIICAAKHIVNVNDGHRVVFPCMPLIINVIKHTQQQRWEFISRQLINYFDKLRLNDAW